MFVLLFALWILFNGKITLEICLFGLVISGAIYLFAIKLLDYDPKKELKALKKLGRHLPFPAGASAGYYQGQFPCHRRDSLSEKGG